MLLDFLKEPVKASLDKSNASAFATREHSKLTSI